MCYAGQLLASRQNEFTYIGEQRPGCSDRTCLAESGRLLRNHVFISVFGAISGGSSEVTVPDAESISKKYLESQERLAASMQASRLEWLEEVIGETRGHNSAAKPGNAAALRSALHDGSGVLRGSFGV